MYDQPDGWAGHYGSKLAARAGVMLHAVNLDWSLAEVRAVFLNPANPGSALWTTGSHGQDHGPHESARRLRADYGRCAAKAAQDPAYSSGQEVRQELSVVRAQAGASIWAGRNGKTDKAMLLGILGRMIAVGSDRINLSVRDASLAAGLSPASLKPAQKSLARLVESGWLERSQPEQPACQLAPGPARAAVYKLAGVAKRPHINLKGSPGECYMGSKGNTCDPAHECWLHLGKGAGTLWSLLTDDPKGVRELARQAAVSPSTVSRRQLPKLTEYDLAVSRDQGWILGPSTPDDVVKTQGWVGNESKTARRRQGVALDRIGYDIGGRKILTVEQAMREHPGLASEIDRKFGGLKAEGQPAERTAA
jgi:hypothetical protein